MKCPVDGTQLMMTARNGVEIDYCPDCRGVWLDRGELDKIIERSADQAAPMPAQTGRDDRRDHHDDSRKFDDRRDYDDRRDHGSRRDYDDRRGYDGKPYKRKKRGGFLDDLFDF